MLDGTVVIFGAIFGAFVTVFPTTFGLTEAGICLTGAGAGLLVVVTFRWVCAVIFGSLDVDELAGDVMIVSLLMTTSGVLLPANVPRLVGTDRTSSDLMSPTTMIGDDLTDGFGVNAAADFG